MVQNYQNLSKFFFKSQFNFKNIVLKIKNIGLTFYGAVFLYFIYRHIRTKIQVFGYGKW